MTKKVAKKAVKKKAKSARAGGYAVKKALKKTTAEFVGTPGLDEPLYAGVSNPTIMIEPEGTYGAGDYDAPEASTGLTLVDYALLVGVVVVGFIIGYFVLA